MSLKIKFATCILLFFACFSYAEDNASKSSYKQHIKELVEKYPIKPHHAKLYFDCMHCHTNQGDNPEKFKNPGDKGCLSFHKSKEHIAQRTKFMDTLKQIRIIQFMTGQICIAMSVIWNIKNR